MPIYEYECLACKHRFERSQRFSDAPLTECPECGGAVRRVIFPAGVVFKGSGWYITDSRKTDSSSTGPGKVESKGDAKGETKGETKAESKESTASSMSSSESAPAAKAATD